MRSRGPPSGEGEALRLVGDDAPGDVAFFQRIDQRSDAVEQAGVGTECLLVVDQEAIIVVAVVRMFRPHVEADTQHAAYALGNIRAQGCQRQRRVSALTEKAIECRAQVGRGIGKGAVQVEEDSPVGALAPAGQASRMV